MFELTTKSLFTFPSLRPKDKFIYINNINNILIFISKFATLPEIEVQIYTSFFGQTGCFTL